jgi:hypothetical protein
MAKFQNYSNQPRHFRAGDGGLPGQLGWEPMDPSDKPCFWCNHGHGGGEHYQAQLETGDHLSLHSMHDPRSGVQNWLGIVSRYPQDKRPPDDAITYDNHDLGSAIDKFEKAYLGMDRQGQNPSSVDYDSLINPRDGLDDDFGDIFKGSARGRRFAAVPGLDWQHGLVLPHTKEFYDHRRQEVIDDNDGYSNPDNYDATKGSIAFANHGEQRYGLEVMPFIPWLDSDPGLHTWYIQKQNGPDADNPDHWGYHFHLMRQHGHGSKDPSGALYTGSGRSREEAMAGAEENLQKHIDHLNSKNPGLGDYDINDIMRDQGF